MSSSGPSSHGPERPPPPAAPAQPHRPGSTYQPRPVKPRKVRGGIRLTHADHTFPESWPAQRWMALIQANARPEALTGGLEYARLGQTRRMTIDPGKIRAGVQGTVISSYECSITLPVLTHEQSERVIGAMVDQAVYAAKLLAGELPPTIEDVFTANSLHLFPTAGEMTCGCNCREQIKPWCKHVCCAAYLVAERFLSDPFLIFTLRGLPREELLERLRQRRAVTGSGAGTALVYSPVIPGVSDAPAPPLEEVADRFWEPGAALHQVDLPIQPPEVSHPLLRRLGPSPFTGGRFPLVGLLATSYGMISEAVLRQAEGAEGPAPELIEEPPAEDQDEP